MDQAAFDEECQRLARPRLNLLRRQQSGEVVGVWGGTGPLSPPAGDWRHWITVSCDWLSRNGFAVSGLLGVYENTNGDHFHEFTAVTGEATGGRLLGGGGVELVGTEDVALPPPEALEVYGSPAMRELTQRGNEGNPLATYQERCPLFYADAEGIFATLGGWHVPWPENDAYDDELGRLVLWTFKDSEPWLEVWQRPSGQLRVVPRIT